MPDTHKTVYVPQEVRDSLDAAGPNAGLLLTTMLVFGIAILVFGLLVLVAAGFALHRQWIPKKHAFRLFFGILIVTLACFLAVAGFGQAQIAWVTGLFGAIVGYLFQNAIAERSDDEPRTNTPAEPR